MSDWDKTQTCGTWNRVTFLSADWSDRRWTRCEAEMWIFITAWCKCCIWPFARKEVNNYHCWLCICMTIASPRHCGPLRVQHLSAVTLPVRPGWRAGDPQVCYHTRQNREKQKHTWGCGDTCGAQVKRKWLRSVCKQMNVRWNAQTSLEPSCGCFWNPSIVSLNFNKITFLCKKWDTRNVCVCLSCKCSHLLNQGDVTSPGNPDSSGPASNLEGHKQSRGVMKAIYNNKI